ncbi:MAG: hypothetical protein AAGA56_12915 [Myxococcota bacterium]
MRAQLKRGPRKALHGAAAIPVDLPPIPSDRRTGEDGEDLVDDLVELVHRPRDMPDRGDDRYLVVAYHEP